MTVRISCKESEGALFIRSPGKINVQMGARCAELLGPDDELSVVYEELHNTEGELCTTLLDLVQHPDALEIHNVVIYQGASDGEVG